MLKLNSSVKSIFVYQVVNLKPSLVGVVGAFIVSFSFAITDVYALSVPSFNMNVTVYFVDVSRIQFAYNVTS